MQSVHYLHGVNTTSSSKNVERNWREIDEKVPSDTPARKSCLSAGRLLPCCIRVKQSRGTRVTSLRSFYSVLLFQFRLLRNNQRTGGWEKGRTPVSDSILVLFDGLGWISRRRFTLNCKRNWKREISRPLFQLELSLTHTKKEKCRLSTDRLKQLYTI